MAASERRVPARWQSAIVGKDTHGHVHKREKPTQHGVAIGALLGVLFPGAAVGGAVVGGIAGGLAGHFSREMSRKDMHDLGKTIEEGEWALVVLAKSRIDQYVDRVFKHAAKQIEKEIKVDRKEFEKAPSEEFEAERELATL